MSRSEIPGNKDHNQMEVEKKFTEYYLRGAQPLIKKVDRQIDPIELTKNKTSKKLVHYDPEMATRSSQMDNRQFLHLRDKAIVNEGNLGYHYFSGNHKDNKLIEKDRKIEVIKPMNVVSKEHRTIEDLSSNPLLGVTKVQHNNKLSNYGGYYEGNRDPYIPQVFSNLRQNKIIYKTVS